MTHHGVSFIQKLMMTVVLIPQSPQWISCQNKFTIKIMAYILMDIFRSHFGLTDVAAATEAGLVVGYSEKVSVFGIKNFMKMKETVVSQ